MMTMMTRTLPTLLALLMSLALVGSPAHAAPQSRSELKARFEQRMPQIDRLKDQGKIGESWTGYLEPVKGEGDLNEQSKKLVAEENADRKKLYAMIADDPTSRMAESVFPPKRSPSAMAAAISAMPTRMNSSRPATVIGFSAARSFNSSAMAKLARPGRDTSTSSMANL